MWGVMDEMSEAESELRMGDSCIIKSLLGGDYRIDHLITKLKALIFRSNVYL